MELLNNLEPLLRTFWYVAIPTSILFTIQTILTFVGSDSADGLSSDFDSDFSHTEAPFELFSLRNLINFLLGFSWTGISFYTTITNKSVLIAFAVAIGCAFVFLFFLLIKQIQKLAEDNSFKIEFTLNKTAEVYLTIPENKSGYGKILISVNGTYHELEAMTDNDKIQSGTKVTVIRIENNNTLIVNPI